MGIYLKKMKRLTEAFTKDLNMDDKCKCGQPRLPSSWMCKTCYDHYMRTGDDPFDLPQTFTSIDQADRYQVSEAFVSIWDKKSTAEIEAALNEEPCEELETSAKPRRYNQSELEYWDAVKGLSWDYFQGAAGKYIHRYHDKNGPEDLVKAINYCVKMISIETGIDYYELHKLTPEELGKRIKK